MDLAIVAVLALALGFVLGVGAGMVRALRFEARRRAAAGASGVLAQVWGDAPPVRSPADIWAGRIRITLGGLEHVLPVAPKRIAAAWLEQLDDRFAATAALIEAKEVPDALRALNAHTDALHDLLIDYAATVGVTLPARDSELDFATAPEVLRATVEVWAALHPLAVALVTGERSPTSGPSPASTSSSLASSDGAATTSTTSSPTSSWSPISTPRRSASSSRRATSSTAGSKPSASARSSRTTPSSTAAGAHGHAPAAGSEA